MRAWVRNSLIFIGLVVAILAIAAYVLLSGQTAEYTIEQLSGPNPEISDPRSESFPTIKIAEITGWGDDESPIVADDLTVSRFAEGLDHPRQMYRLPNGDILVAETNSPPRENTGIEGWVFRNLIARAGAGSASANRISLLRDADGDGIAEQKSVFLEGLNSPFGMALIGDTLYVANTDAVLAFPYSEGDTKITAKGEKIADLNDSKPNNHWTRNLIASADGTSLFVAVGSNSNIGENGMDTETQRAAILEIQLDLDNELREYASGLRNPVGMDIHPETDALWTVVNERDMLGPDLVPDYLAEVGLGTQFGWPHYYYGGYQDTRVEEPLLRDLSDYIRKPDYALGAHVAPLGVVFSHESAFCGDFAKGAFIARHGSWNRKPAAGYDVVYVAFADDGEPTEALPVDILTGFLTDGGDARGRPTMVEIDATGALLVTDDVTGIIWRVAPKPGSCPAVAETTEAGDTTS
ncbi:PQQ-dependent sugar dehydrogenase [Alterisphingorhabdus coralli]|uniref:PQQ-dependent sugar dehydrogenase n=1 Tax=Alterisphingorhabdus coralli TaxID=3071408 RepID=A0AA97HZJ0_9SPHN|nr:PQQ-dependent sugar dehydrogenase [Parasphingorhabdus sp. SCSIO 66989]WOE74734.1 PQQ-dependent sugar dehydrogenase [Parasphingorhabdus sp. SCSIO 66989]